MFMMEHIMIGGATFATKIEMNKHATISSANSIDALNIMYVNVKSFLFIVHPLFRYHCTVGKLHYTNNISQF